MALHAKVLHFKVLFLYLFLQPVLSNLLHVIMIIRHVSFFFCKYLSFKIFCLSYRFPLKNFLRYRFPWKMSPVKVKYLLPVKQILWNFTNGNSYNKFFASFAYCAHLGVKKCRKTLMFSLASSTQLT